MGCDIKASRRESRFQHQTGGSSEGVGLRQEVPKELTGKSADLDEGADEKPEDIPWQSTNDEESENYDEEDESDEDKSIGTEKSDAERTDTDDEDTVMGKAEKIVEQKADEEHEADEEQKGDEHVGDEQVVELKQADHSTVILASIRSQVPSVVKEYLGSSLPDAFQKVLRSHTEELKKELSEEKDYRDIIEEFVQANVNLPPKLFDALTWSMLLDEAKMKKGDKPDTVPKKRDRGDDQDKDPSAGLNQGKKTKKRRVSESKTSKKTSTTKESSKGKSLARTSKSGKSVTAKESVEEPVFEIASDDVEQTVIDKVGDVGQPTHTDADKT
ncbi:hypothetical protein Tco_1167362 [Tanacetum coccineum]